jgi:ribonucleotide reductase alpha subunit
VWLENMRAYGRMGDAPDYKDKRVVGANPCVEQSLESYEVCNLVETFPAKHDSLEDYKRTLKFAYLYAKTVTLGRTIWTRTNRVMLRNRRIGLSQSGVQQAVSKLGVEEYRRWCDEGYKTVRKYDDVYSEWLAIPKSVKVTSVKPSGSVSLVVGATPGMHWPESRHYIRRVRLGKDSNLLPPLEAAGYVIEPDVTNQDTTVVVEIPVMIEEQVRTTKEVSMWEQLAMAAFLQRYWADNQVSATITFDPEREGPDIAAALQHYQYQLKGVSFLPKTKRGAYPQMPYEEISEAEYKQQVANLKPLTLGTTYERAEQEKYCDSAVCTI